MSKLENSICQDEGVLRIFIRGRAVSLLVPSCSLPYSLEAATPPPATRLRLEWVYGYRGRDARANLQLLPTGEVRNLVCSCTRTYLS